MIPTTGPLCILFPLPKQSFLSFPVAFWLLYSFISDILSKEAFFDRITRNCSSFSRYWAFFFFFLLHGTFFDLAFIFFCFLVYCLTSSLEYKLHESRLFVFLCAVASVLRVVSGP